RRPPTRSPRLPSAPPRPLGRSRFGQRALAYLSLVILAGGGLGWLLRRAPATASAEADVGFDVLPVGAALRLHGAALADGRVRLPAGSSHALAAEARGFLPIEARFQARPGRLAIRLLHTLPAVDDADVPALPAALPPAAVTAPPSWDDVDRGIRRAEMLR